MCTVMIHKRKYQVQLFMTVGYAYSGRRDTFAVERISTAMYSVCTEKTPSDKSEALQTLNQKQH